MPINTPTARHCPHAERGRGNADEYQASVFNFARTWESIYLNLDLDALSRRRAHAANFRGGYLVTFACGSRGMFGARLPA